MRRIGKEPPQRLSPRSATESWLPIAGPRCKAYPLVDSVCSAGAGRAADASAARRHRSPTVLLTYGCALLPRLHFEKAPPAKVGGLRPVSRDGSAPDALPRSPASSASPSPPACPAELSLGDERVASLNPRAGQLGSSRSPLPPSLSLFPSLRPLPCSSGSSLTLLKSLRVPRTHSRIPLR